MDESVVNVLEGQQVGTLKLSAAIRIGVDLVKDQRYCFLGLDGNGDLCGCALGAAAAAVGLTRLDVDGLFSDLRDRFGVSDSLLEQISERHFRRLMTREQIADWLEAQGL